MTTASVTPAVIDALVTVAKAVVETGATPGKVIDGPGTQDMGSYPVICYIGMGDGDDLDYALTSTEEQAWAFVGHQYREADLTVMCSIVAWNGQANQKAARDKALATLQAFTDKVTTDPTLGNIVNHVRGVSGVTWLQAQTDLGAEAKVNFGIAMTAYIN